MTSETRNRILTAHYPSFRSSHLRKLRLFFGDFGKAWDAKFDSLRKAGLSKKISEGFLDWRGDMHGGECLKKIQKEKISVLFLDDGDYPLLLKQISDPPETLFIRGHLPDAQYLSFVGSRKYSQYGHVCVNMIIPEAVQGGFATVSGLALGIDGLVHKKTLDHGGKTIAVLGTGVDNQSIYPRSHIWLAERIIEEGGAIISEFPPGTLVRKEHFPIRNRIIAGLSLGTIVIEAGIKSGSLITARLALEENRDVFAIPGNITSPMSAGTNQLLKYGAIPCTDFRSVIEGLSLDPQIAVSLQESRLPLSLHERAILQELREERHIDELKILLDMDASALGATLSSLELRGAVSHLGSQKWIVASGLP